MDSEINNVGQEYIDRFINDEYPVEVTEEKILDFVKYTDHISSPKEERVLALALETGYNDFKNGWQDLKLLYDYTLQHCKKEERFDYLIDWIVVALDWSNKYLGKTTLYDERIKIANDCLLKLEEAVKLQPNKASIHHIFGIFYYGHPNMEEEVNLDILKKALSHFLKAFEIDPLKYITCLHIAHCYHDLKEWEKARVYYEKMDREFFIKKNPHWEWRIWKAEEQICLCDAMIGDIDVCKKRFDTFLSKIERMSDEKFDDVIINFDESFQLTPKIKDESLTKRLLDIVISKEYGNRYKKEIRSLQKIKVRGANDEEKKRKKKIE